MALINGTNLTIKVGGVALLKATTASLELSVDLPDATTKDSAGWSEFFAGVRSFTLSSDGLVDYAMGSQVETDELVTMLINRATVAVTFSTATAGLVGHDGTNFYTVEPTLGYRQFTLSGTTMTFVGNVTVTGANYSYLSGRVNHIGIYAQSAASPNFRFASHAGVLDVNRQCGASATQGFCTKSAFYNSSNNEIYLRNFL